MTFSAMAWFREHREQIRGLRPRQSGSGLHVRQPDAAARDSDVPNLDDESDEPSGPHLRSRPSAVDSVGDIEITNRDLGDGLPHQSSMTHEEIEVPERRSPNGRARHRPRMEAVNLPVCDGEESNLKQG